MPGSRRNWPARRASRRNSSVARRARTPPMRTPRPVPRTPLGRAVRFPGVAREHCAFQRRGTPGAYGSAASRPRRRTGAAGCLPWSAVSAARAEVREFNFEHPDAAGARVAPAGSGVLRVSCPYADCDGQFDLSGAVKSAIAAPKHQAVGVLECAGQRVRDHASRQPCQLRLLYTVTATYQTES